MKFTIITFIYASFYALHQVWEIILNRLDRNLLHRQTGRMVETTDGMDRERFQKSLKYHIEWKDFSLVYQGFDIVAQWALILFIINLTDRLIVQLHYGPLASGLLFFTVLTFYQVMIQLPYDFYGDFVIEQKYGFNKKTPIMFFADLIKMLLMVLIIGAPLAAGVLAFMQHAGMTWWLWAFCLIFIYQIGITWIYPVLIAPLFNKFTPIESDLAMQIKTLLEKQSFKLSGIFSMDGSKRSSHANAFFTGFGKSKRIVLYDTLLSSLNADQILAVLAHEIGHSRLAHIKKRMTIAMIGQFCLLAVLAMVKNYEILYPSFGFARSSDYAALIIFSFIISEATFPFSFLSNYFSRKHEYESDRFAAELTGSPNHLIEALQIMHENNCDISIVHPLYSAYYHSHPTLRERIEKLNLLKVSNQ